MGPISVAAHLAPFLPVQDALLRSHSVIHALRPEELRPDERGKVGAISAAPFSSASILTIPWMYIRMMGGDGLTQATRIAILNANYIARRLDACFPVLFKGNRAWLRTSASSICGTSRPRRPRT